MHRPKNHLHYKEERFHKKKNILEEAIVWDDQLMQISRLVGGRVRSSYTPLHLWSQTETRIFIATLDRPAKRR
jgi:hypothetical protein